MLLLVLPFLLPLPNPPVVFLSTATTRTPKTLTFYIFIIIHFISMQSFLNESTLEKFQLLPLVLRMMSWSLYSSNICSCHSLIAATSLLPSCFLVIRYSEWRHMLKLLFFLLLLLLLCKTIWRKNEILARHNNNDEEDDAKDRMLSSISFSMGHVRDKEWGNFKL